MTKPERFSSQQNTEPYGDFSRRQKTAVIFLAVLSLAVVAAWLIQINHQIRQPFKSPSHKVQNSAADLDLALIDSDGDGLSDYDELYIYKTSPYLEDTDGDGINDYDEVSLGTNPNCPEGKNCYAGEDLIIREEVSSSELLLSPGIENLETGELSGSTAIINSSQVTPEILRQVLLESGYDRETLNQISDDDLMASYQEALRAGSEPVSAE